MHISDEERAARQQALDAAVRVMGTYPPDRVVIAARVFREFLLPPPAGDAQN